MIFIILLITIVISGFSYSFATQAIRDIEMRISNNNAEMIANMIDDKFGSIEELLLDVVQIPTVRYIGEMIETDVLDNDLETTSNIIDNSVMKLLNRGDSEGYMPINFVNLYMKNGYSYSSLLDTQLNYSDFSSCYQYLISNKMVSDTEYIPVTWTETIVAKNSTGAIEQTIIVVRFIYDSITLDKIGVVVAGVPEDEISSLYEDVFTEAYIFQNNGQIISSSEYDQLDSKAVDDEIVSQIMSAKVRSDSIDYTVDGEEESALFWKNSYSSTYFVVPMTMAGLFFGEKGIAFAKKSLTVVILAMIVGGIGAYLLTRALSKSVLSLKKMVTKVYEGDEEARYLPVHNDEIAYLGLHINDMLDRLQEAYTLREHDVVEKTQLELQLLQAQINPHLLYNTLNSVLLAIKTNESEKAENLVFKISNFFRLSLSKGNVLISLATEIQIISDYIDLQNMARHKSLVLDVDIDEKILSYKILRITILPIVENAVIHGLSGYRDNGVIKVFCKTDEDILKIIVLDNGVGIEEEKLEQLNCLLNFKSRLKENKHFGLYNVNWRIKNHFGIEYGISIESEVSEYTKIVILLPLCIDGKNDSYGN